MTERPADSSIGAIRVLGFNVAEGGPILRTRTIILELDSHSTNLDQYESSFTQNEMRIGSGILLMYVSFVYYLTLR